MRSGIVFIGLLGVSVSAATLVSLKGGKGMSMHHNDTEIVIALPPSGTPHSGAFETTTFALG
jgi:hypothetical protein